MGTLVFEDKKYTFDWGRIALLFLGAPIFALTMYFSHQWIWLHEITSKLTIILLNLIYPGSFESVYTPENYISWIEFIRIMFKQQHLPAVWAIKVFEADGSLRGTIGFETLCTGVHAMAIFIGAILFSPHAKEKETTKDIWTRKGKAILTTSIVFYFVNILRMIIQLSLYRNGAAWDDVHYPISAASSFIAVACVLLLHKYVPEFIMSLIWIGDEIREKYGKPIEDEETMDEEDSNEYENNNDPQSNSIDEHLQPEEETPLKVSKSVPLD